MAQIETEVTPLSIEASGTIRVGGTRVTLDSILASFHAGATAEEIAVQFPAVPLADIYHAIGYYLRHTADVDAYLADRARLREAVVAENQARWPSVGLRARLLGRKSSR